MRAARVTGFANLEERLIGLTRGVPFLLEDRLKQAGGRYHRAFLPFAPHVEEDDRLVTGQTLPLSAASAGAWPRCWQTARRPPPSAHKG